MLSQTSKLGCKSWSLNAVETCPGTISSAGSFVEICEVCYARSGNYRFPVVRSVRDSNRADWTRPDFGQRVISALASETRFRWFDSGDAYDLKLVDKIISIVKGTPNVKHWLPTRMWKFKKFKHKLEELSRLDNCVVRYSADNFDEVLDFGHNATVLTKPNPAVYNCPAYKQGGKCLDCRACWDKSIPTIGYLGHGRSFDRVIKLKELK